MEEGIFPLPVVTEELKKNFIEARLHTDSQGQLEPEVDARNKQLQDEMTKSKANPYFIIYDPKTEKVLRKKAGMIFEQKFLEFLRGKAGNGPDKKFEQR
jgi:hypothetical protein